MSYRRIWDIVGKYSILCCNRREHGGHGKGDQPAIAGAEHIDLGLHFQALQHGNQALGLKRLRAAGVGGGGLSEEDEVRDVDGELRLQEGLQLQLPRRHALPPEPMHQYQRRTSRGGARRNQADADRGAGGEGVAGEEHAGPGAAVRAGARGEGGGGEGSVVEGREVALSCARVGAGGR
jgi:hypothetical protein